MRVWLFAAMAAIGIAVGACSVPERGPAVPRADTERALPLGIANARFYPDGDPQADDRRRDRGIAARDCGAAARRERCRRPTTSPSRAAATTARSAPAC